MGVDAIIGSLSLSKQLGDNLIFTSFTKNKTTSVARAAQQKQPHLPHLVGEMR